MVAMVMQSDELHGGEMKRLKTMQDADDANFTSLRPVHPWNSNRDTDDHRHGMIHTPPSPSSSSSSPSSSSPSSSSISACCCCCDRIKICNEEEEETLDFHIPGFEILGLVGEGSYGRIYKAKKKSNTGKRTGNGVHDDDAQEPLIALKVFKTRFSADKADSGICSQLPPEPQMEMAMSMMLSKQASPSTPIVRTLGFHFHFSAPVHVNGYGKQQYRAAQAEAAMSMDFCHGGSLLDFMKRMESPSIMEMMMAEREARLFVRPIAMALQFCHDRNVLHLDVKPANILLREPGCLASACLADFGLGLILPKCGSRYAESAPGRGTPCYMAPEAQIYGIYSTSSDVWSLGVVLLEALTGHIPPPPPCGSQMGAHWRTLSRVPAWTKLSKPARGLIKWMLCPDPQMRMHLDELLHHPWLLQTD